MTEVQRPPIVTVPGLYREFEGTPDESFDGSLYSYQDLLNTFSGVGYDSRFHQPNWGCDNPRIWASDLVENVRDTISPGVPYYLSGFSIGTVVVSLAMEELRKEHPPAGLVLISPAPDFEPVFTDFKLATKGMPTDFNTVVRPALQRNLEGIWYRRHYVPTQVYHGVGEFGGEFSYAEKAAKILLRLWPKASMISVEGAAHNVDRMARLTGEDGNPTWDTLVGGQRRMMLNAIARHAGMLLLPEALWAEQSGQRIWHMPDCAPDTIEPAHQTTRSPGRGQLTGYWA